MYFVQPGLGAVRNECEAGSDLLLDGIHSEGLVDVGRTVVGLAQGFRSAEGLQGAVEVGRRPAGYRTPG